MNERIKECWLKAAREDSSEKWDTQEEFIERFAELIVKECANAIQEEKDTGLYTAQQSAGLIAAKTLIKDYFGVE